MARKRNRFMGPGKKAQKRPEPSPVGEKAMEPEKVDNDEPEARPKPTSPFGRYMLHAGDFRPGAD